MTRSQLALPGGAVRACEWCQKTLPFESRPSRRFCDQTCRQWAFRVRQRREVARVYGKPMRFRYDDPPYIGTAWRYYKMPEVDHAELIRDALSQNYDGYALSCSSDSLRIILPMFPADLPLHICSWVKPHKPSPNTKGVQACWDAVILVGGRQEPPGRRDWFSGLPARGGGDLPGRKTIAFGTWLYELFGAGPGDTLFEKFKGTGIITRVFAELQRAEAAGLTFDPSSLQEDDAPSLLEAGDAETVPELSSGLTVEPPAVVDTPAPAEPPSSTHASDAAPMRWSTSCLVCGAETEGKALCPDHWNAEAARNHGLDVRPAQIPDLSKDSRVRFAEPERWPPGPWIAAWNFGGEWMWCSRFNSGYTSSKAKALKFAGETFQEYVDEREAFRAKLAAERKEREKALAAEAEPEQPSSTHASDDMFSPVDCTACGDDPAKCQLQSGCQLSPDDNQGSFAEETTGLDLIDYMAKETASMLKRRGKS